MGFPSVNPKLVCGKDLGLTKDRKHTAIFCLFPKVNDWIHQHPGSIKWCCLWSCQSIARMVLSCYANNFNNTVSQWWPASVSPSLGLLSLLSQLVLWSIPENSPSVIKSWEQQFLSNKTLFVSFKYWESRGVSKVKIQDFVNCVFSPWYFMMSSIVQLLAKCQEQKCHFECKQGQKIPRFDDEDGRKKLML